MLKSIFCFLLFFATSSAFGETEMERYVFSRNGISGAAQSDALIVNRGGQTLVERYARGYKPESRHIAWSVTKSFTATMIGMAIEKGQITLQDSVCKGHSDWVSNEHCQITVEDLLNWSSGIKWNENPKTSDQAKITVAQMLAGPGRFDMFRYFLNLPFANKHGTVYSYSTGDSTALTGLLKSVWGPDENPWKNLFDPLNITEVTFEQDMSGLYVGGALIYISARDLLKFGQFYLNKGQIDGKQLVPASWIDYLTAPNTNFKLTSEFADSTVPLKHFRKPTVALNNEIPSDTYMAVGLRGQYLIVIPSMQLVAVRFGDDQHDDFDISQFLRLMVAEVAPSLKPMNAPTKQYYDLRDEADPLSMDTTSSSLVQLGSRLTSHFYCSCRYVSGLSDQACREMVHFDPNVFRVRTNDDKEVIASVIGFWSSKSEYRNDRLGCVSTD